VAHILRHGFVALAVALSTLGASAQEFPNRPLKMIVGFVPGGGSDISARILADLLQQKLGQPVIVENKPGAASMIGVDFVAKAPADGYTLLHTNSDGITILPAVRKGVPYTVPKDFSFVAQILQASLVVAVSSKLPVNTMAEFIAYAKANPGKLKYGTSGVGTGPHLATILLEKQAGIKLVHVPYKGTGGSINDLVGGHIDLALLAPQPIAPHAEGGKVKILANTGKTRDPLFPNAPTMTEVGVPGATVLIWYGILAPPGLPANVLDRLRKDTVAVLNSPEGQERYKKAGFALAPLEGTEFEKIVNEEAKLWKEIADAEKIVVEE
jgi:tripartite-type tricarboxylate transporter receptor subunit TctC